MKNMMIGILVGLVLALPVGVLAWSTSQEAVPIKAYNCKHQLGEDGQREPYSCLGVVDRFDDRDNTCYLTHDKGAISCVKR